MTNLEQWGRGAEILFRLFIAGLIVVIAMIPVYLIPDSFPFYVKLTGLAYAAIIAPYVFYRVLQSCGLSIRILNKDSTNGTENEGIVNYNDRINLSQDESIPRLLQSKNKKPNKSEMATPRKPSD